MDMLLMQVELCKANILSPHLLVIQSTADPIALTIILSDSSLTVCN